MAEHLSRGPNLSADYLRAYKEARDNPELKAMGEGFVAPDINKLWRFSPNAPIFKQGYKHHDYIEGLVRGYAQQRARAAQQMSNNAAYAAHIGQPGAVMPSNVQMVSVGSGPNAQKVPAVVTQGDQRQGAITSYVAPKGYNTGDQRMGNTYRPWVYTGQR